MGITGYTRIDRDAVADYYAKGLSATEIAKRLDRPRPSIGRVIREINEGPIREAIDVHRAATLIADGMSTRDAAREVRTTEASLRAALSFAGYSIRDLRDGTMKPDPAANIHPAEIAARKDGADPALIATGGRYADLAAYADQRGIPYAAALSRWHRLGISVRKAPR